MKEEPKRCPFCGHVATVEKWHGGGPQKTMVHCEGCYVSPGVTGPTRKTAIKRWNERAPS